MTTEAATLVFALLAEGGQAWVGAALLLTLAARRFALAARVRVGLFSLVAGDTVSLAALIAFVAGSHAQPACNLRREVGEGQ